MRLWKNVGLASLIAAIAASGCAPGVGRDAGAGPGASAAQTTPKRVVAGIRGNPKFVVNSLTSGGGGAVDGGAQLSGLTSAGLSVQTANGKWEPRLAEALPSVENGNWRVFPDGRMETVWRIREGAVWHDGTPFTADDVVFTARLSQDREMPWLVPPFYKSIDKVEAVDPRTVKVSWKETYIRADQVTFRPEYPKHILEEPYTRGDKQNISNLPYWSSAFVGTGAFKVKDWQPDSHVVLAAFDQYILGRPKIDELEVRFIPDDTTLAANLLAGAVDFNMGQGLTIEAGIQVRDHWSDGSMLAGPNTDNHLNTQFLNPDPPIILNANFRKALMMAIDRQQMVDEFSYGTSQVLHANISPYDQEWPYIESQVVKYPYDPRRSGQMIDELGYRKGGDGMYVDAAGKPLSVQIMATTDEYNAKAQAAVLDMWKRIGITPDLEAVTSQKQRDLEYRASFRSFSLQGGQSFGPDGWEALHSRQMRTAEKNYAGNNYTRYSNPEADMLVDRYFSTIPFTERMQIMGQLVHLTTDQLVWFPLYLRVLATMVNNRLSSVTVMGAGDQWANAHEWTVK